MRRRSAENKSWRIPLLIVVWVAGVSRGMLAADALYEVTVEKDVMVPMRDGVRLATDVYLPVRPGAAADERLPVILERRPYNKDGCASSGRYYAARGYAFVAQDTRGRYKSEGVWHMLTDDGPDGVDTAAWIGQQPWSNGKIGMIGTSYVGGTQHAMAMAKAPELTTVIPVDAMSNLGYASMRNGARSSCGSGIGSCSPARAAADKSAIPARRKC
jgi:uncharacterized protein